MALTDGIEVNTVELDDVIDWTCTANLNNTNTARVRITNKGNVNATTIEAGDTLSFYRDSTLILEGLALAPFDYSHAPSTITVNVLGYGAELARKNVYLPHSYEMEKGRTLTVEDVISGYPWQHGDGLFEAEPASTGTDGWIPTGAVTRSSTQAHSGDYSWELDATAADADIIKKIYVDPTKYDKIKVSLWAYPDDGACGLRVRSGDGSWTQDTTNYTDGWERLEVTKSLESGDTYFEVQVYVPHVSTELSYVDDFCYCLHVVGDDTSVYNNGILAGTGYNDADVSCDIELDGYETRNNTTVVQALRAVRSAAGENDYCWWFGPAAKALHFKAYPTTENTGKAIVRDNVYSIKKRTDPTQIINSMSITTTSEESDWYKIYASSAGDAIQAIWQRGRDIIINVQNASNSKMYVSHDNGATWTATKTFSASSTYAYRVQHDAISDIVYLSTNAEGMFYSTDRGDTWSAFDANIQFGNYFQVDNGTTVYEFKMGDVSGSGKIYRQAHGGPSWTDITPTIGSVTNFYLPLVSGTTVCMEGFEGDGSPDNIVRTLDITVASPSWTTEYTTAGNYSAATDANGFYGGCVKRNYRTNQDYLYYSIYNNTPVAAVLRSVDGGDSWQEVFTSADGDDDVPGEMDANDGLVYCVIRADGDITAATKYGRIISSVDDGENWITAVDGTSSVIYSYALLADGNTIIVARDVPDGGTSRGELIRRTDAYNAVVTVRDDTSISAYGEYVLPLMDQIVQTYDVAEVICNGIIDRYAEPIVTYEIHQKLDVSLELAKTYTIEIGVRFPLTFPISWDSPVPLPSEAITVVSMTYYYPLNKMVVSIGTPMEDVSSALSRLVERHIEDSATEDIGVCISEGSDDSPGIIRTPGGKLVRARGTTTRGGNYVLERVRRNGTGRAKAW